jgi:hypothetical protein
MRQPNTNEITVAPSLVDIDIANTYETLYSTDNTDIGIVFPPDIVSEVEVQAAIEYRNAFKQSDVITSVTKFFDSLSTYYFNQADFSLENIIFWYQKLNYTNKEIFSYRSASSFQQNNVIPNQIPGASQIVSNVFNSGSYKSLNYFDNVSDSIGIITNSKYLQLDSTLPLFDINQEFYGVPVPYSASLENKISANTRNVMYDLSQKTTTYMRHNLMGVGYTNLTLQQNLAADASTSHGLNLINDLPTFVTINESLGILKDKLSSVFAEAKIFGFIQYVSNIANQTAMNLRDIFPVASDDKDFVVITSEERANASQAIRDQEVSNALAEQSLYAQQQNFFLADQANYNPNVGLRPYTPTGEPTQPGDTAALNYDPNAAPSPITGNMVDETGQVTTRNVSTYGGPGNDFTTYLDIKPPRPKELTDYWKGQGYNIEAQEAAMYRKYPNWKPSLSLEDTARGAYVGSKLTANFDVAVSKSYGYPPGTLLKITDKSGNPVGASVGNKDGIFRVGDTGGGSLKSRNALDFYTGNDPNVKKYYEKLDSAGGGLRVEVVKLKA